MGAGGDTSEEGGERPFETCYFDAVALRRFLATRAQGESGVLQKFVIPRTSANSVICAVWTPHASFVSMRRSRLGLHEPSDEPWRRGVTFDGPLECSAACNLTPPVTSRVERAMTELVAIICATESVSVRGIVAMLKIDRDDRLLLLRCTCIRTSNGPMGLSLSSRLPVTLPMATAGSGTARSNADARPSDAALKELSRRERVVQREATRVGPPPPHRRRSTSPPGGHLQKADGIPPPPDDITNSPTTRGVMSNVSDVVVAGTDWAWRRALSPHAPGDPTAALRTVFLEWIADARYKAAIKAASPISVPDDELIAELRGGDAARPPTSGSSGANPWSLRSRCTRESLLRSQASMTPSLASLAKSTAASMLAARSGSASQHQLMLTDDAATDEPSAPTTRYRFVFPRSLWSWSTSGKLSLETLRRTLCLDAEAAFDNASGRRIDIFSFRYPEAPLAYDTLVNLAWALFPPALTQPSTKVEGGGVRPSVWPTDLNERFHQRLARRRRAKADGAGGGIAAPGAEGITVVDRRLQLLQQSHAPAALGSSMDLKPCDVQLDPRPASPKARSAAGGGSSIRTDPSSLRDDGEVDRQLEEELSSSSDDSTSSTERSGRMSRHHSRHAMFRSQRSLVSVVPDVETKDTRQLTPGEENHCPQQPPSSRRSSSSSDAADEQPRRLHVDKRQAANDYDRRRSAPQRRADRRDVDWRLDSSFPRLAPALPSSARRFRSRPAADAANVSVYRRPAVVNRSMPLFTSDLEAIALAPRPPPPNAQQQSVQLRYWIQ